MTTERKNGSPIPRFLSTPYTTGQLIQAQKNESFKGALHNRKLQIQRRRNIAACKILGMSNVEIGKIFKMRKERVSHELKFADQEGLLDRLNSQILDELVPEAIKVYRDKMVKEQDAFVAKDVLKHLDRLTSRLDTKKDNDSPKYSVEAYIQAKSQNVLGEEGVIDITKVIHGERAKQLFESSSVPEVNPKQRMDILEGVVVEENDGS